MRERVAERWPADTIPSEKYSIYTRANAGEVDARSRLAAVVDDGHRLGGRPRLA